MKYFKMSRGMVKFLIYPSFSLNKVIKLKRYSSLYLRMMDHKESKIKSDLEEYYKLARQET